ncbi:MAG: putative ABC transport system permease protein [Mariniblastus sp.]|jgi:putative ABC transport system permease protein
MTQWQIAFRSFKFYLRTNLAIALGVAAATAVLTGALVVGSSMRNSLRELTLERLGEIDEILVSDGFFNQSLANQIEQTEAFKSHYDKVTPVIMFPGGTVEVERDNSTSRAGQVAVLGIQDDFWSLGNESDGTQEKLTGDVVIINQALADDLGVTAEEVKSGAATVTVRIPKQTQLPADSPMGKKTDLIESIVDLKVVQIIPTQGLGRFGMRPTQSDPLNVYLPIEVLQDSLSRTVLKHKSDRAQANVLMVSAKGKTAPDADVSQGLRNAVRPTLEDLGLRLKHVTQTFGEGDDAKTIYDYWSLSSDKMVLSGEAVDSIVAEFPGSTPVFTYLANDIRAIDKPSGIPFSMIAAVDFNDSFAPESAVSGQPIRTPVEHEIVINQWAAADLGLEIGDKVKVAYFDPETTHGAQTESTVELTIIDIAKLTKPETPFSVSRRGAVTPATYKNEPTLANDPYLTPEVPGVTDAESIENWDLPFQTADRIRSQDDDYWSDYRTTPKGFVSLAAGKRLWGSRFGSTTSFRISNSGATQAALERRLLARIASDEARLGLHLVSVKRQGLEASKGSTPFDALFLGLSMFVIGAALILVSLLFRLGLQQRAAELGIYKATGFNQKQIRRIWLSEMLLVSLFGAVVGVVLGVCYAWLMILGLSTWWVGAIARPFLTLYISPLSLVIGFLSGMLMCVLTISWSLRRTRAQPVRSLLAGELESQAGGLARKGPAWVVMLAYALVAVAILLAVVAIFLSGQAQAISFLSAGFSILTALLIFVYQWLRRPSTTTTAGSLSLSRLAMLNAKRNPLRSTLTIGLVAVSSFLIAALSSFRLTPSELGTAGFDWVAQSSQPVFDDLSTVEGQIKALGVGNALEAGTTVMSFRFKPGEDASCSNLYQSTQPRVLGVSESFVKHFDSPEAVSFGWATSLAAAPAEAQNPWQLLGGKTVHAGTEEDPIPVVIDQNTAIYSLKIMAPGTVRQVQYDSGESIYFRAVAFLENTILQGSLIMSERDFENAFPSTAGYRYFLIDDGPEAEASNAETANLSNSVAMLEDRLSDQGFDARSAPKLLEGFMAVQNTYISTFQTLGALGLLLGTFGLAAVQIRSVLERKKELGLMRAVGFARAKLSKMVLMENAWLLLVGMGVGIVAALFTVLPHWLVGTASVPWLALAAIFAGIAAVGLIAGWLASRIISKTPLLESLRG